MPPPHTQTGLIQFHINANAVICLQDTYHLTIQKLLPGLAAITAY